MSDTPAPPVTEDAAALYETLVHEAPQASAVTTLHIGGSHTTLASGSASGAPALLRTLDLGARVLATTCLVHEPPLPEELHAAAAIAQAAWAPLREHLAPGSRLYTADAGIRQIALAAGLEAQPDMELPLQAVQQLFEQLLQPPAPAHDADAPALPRYPAFAATLVILRACLQTLGFTHLSLRSDAVA